MGRPHRILFQFLVELCAELVLGKQKRVVNQWVRRKQTQIGMLLKMICKFNGLPRSVLDIKAGDHLSGAAA